MVADAEGEAVVEGSTLIDCVDEADDVGDTVIEWEDVKFIVGETDGHVDGVIDVEVEREGVRLILGEIEDEAERDIVADTVLVIVRDGELVDDGVVENDGVADIVGEKDKL